MLYIDLPHEGMVQSPLNTDKIYLGGQGDGFLYQGDQFRTKTSSIKVQYKALTFTQADEVLAAVTQYIESQPARLKFREAYFVIAGEGVEETRGLDVVDLSISLQGAF